MKCILTSSYKQKTILQNLFDKELQCVGFSTRVSSTKMSKLDLFNRLLIAYNHRNI
jgi:hypothetical protein